jgi:hypothetical protein
MVVRLALAAFACAVGCGGRDCPRTIAAPVSPLTPAHTASDLLVPVDLELRVVAGLEHCSGSTRPIALELDGKPVGTVSISCDDVLDLPASAPTYQLVIPRVAPGIHHVRAIDPEGSRETARDILMPAIEPSADGRTALVGGFVDIYVPPNAELHIADPTPMRSSD